METNKLKTFVDLAQTLSFSKTAENLFTTQSSISKQIHSLEKALGISLFIRNNKHVKLSTAGEMILPNTKKILRQEQEIRQKLQQISKQEKETIKMAVIPTFATYLPFVLITKYVKQHPEIDLQLKEVESNQIKSQLKNNEIDFAFIRSLTDKPSFPSIKVKTEKFAMCVAKDDPLAKKEIINLPDVKDKSFIMLTKKSMLYEPVLNLCRKAGFKPNIIFTSERISSIMHMIRNHQGVSLLMDADHQFHGIKFIPVKPTMKSYLYLLRIQKNLSHGKSDFWQYLKRSFNNEKGEKVG